MKFLWVLLSLTLGSCGKSSDTPVAPPEFQTAQPTDSGLSTLTLEGDDDPNLQAELDEAEKNASPDGLRILQTGRMMVQDQIVVVGSCWDFIESVYTHAGYTGKKITTPFASVLAGPFADISTIQPGDWLYFINHSYGDVEHSGVFLLWTDLLQKQALILSYVGGNNVVPGRYSTYDLSNVYNIMRPEAGLAATLPPIVIATPSPSATPLPTL
jgi:hypothetical protein